MEQFITGVFLAIGITMFVFASLQLTARRSSSVNFSLFAVFLSVGYVWFYYGFYRYNRLIAFPWLLYSDIVPTFLVGPLVLSYTLNLVGYTSLSGMKKVLPFVPGLAALAYLIIFHPFTAVSWQNLPGPNPDHFLIPVVRIINSVGDFHFCAHVVASTVIALHTYRKGDARFRSNFRGVLIFYCMTLTTFILFFLGHGLRSDNVLGTAVLLNGIACVYFFFFCYRYPDCTQKQIRLPMGKKSSVPGVDLSKVFAGLQSAVEVEGVFRDPDLTLQSLSMRLGIQNHQLSQILNDYMGMNFRTYINRRRVDEVKRLLAETPDRTILDIAYEVGFNSKSAFNTAFVKETGQTPSDYRKNRQNVLNS